MSWFNCTKSLILLFLLSKGLLVHSLKITLLCWKDPIKTIGTEKKVTGFKWGFLLIGGDQLDSQSGAKMVKQTTPFGHLTKRPALT